jgi:CTP-dependent riboflavin kinase
MQIIGKISDGIGDASKWLKHYEKVYKTELGFSIFPRSLNLICDSRFDWFDIKFAPKIKKFSLIKYGGDREIMIIPCTLPTLNEKNCFLWTTVPQALNPSSGREKIIEIIGKEKLRDKYHLKNDDSLTVEI